MLAPQLVCTRVACMQGQCYWREERRVCQELAQLQPGHQVNLSIADILATHELKSFDYRVRCVGQSVCHTLLCGCPAWVTTGQSRLSGKRVMLPACPNILGTGCADVLQC
jgi:hypothetical protein